MLVVECAAFVLVLGAAWLTPAPVRAAASAAARPPLRRGLERSRFRGARARAGRRAMDADSHKRSRRRHGSRDAIDVDNARPSATAIPLYRTANGFEERDGEHRGSGRTGRARSRSWPGATCGCTSPGCRRTTTHEIPIIVRGEGCYVYDEHGKRYLDGLSALFCVNIGHGRADIAQAGADQAKELGFFTNWSYAHPPAIELAARIAVARPGRPQPGVLHQRRQRGGRVGDQARAPVPQGHRQPEQDQGDRARDRLPRHHARGAVGDRDHSLREPFEPLTPGGFTCPTRTLPDAARASRELVAEAIAEKIEFEGPDTVAAVILEPVQNAGGCFTPARRLLPARPGDLRRVRRAADLRRGHLRLGPARRVVRRRSSTTTSPT